MSMLSRNKGKVGEREAAAMLSALTGLDVRRRVRQHDGDSDLEGVKNWSIEVKRYSTATRAQMAGWWAQCVRQALATGQYPLLVYRLDGQREWTCVWSAALINPALNNGIDQLDRALFTAPAMWWEFSKGSIHLNLDEGEDHGK
jgi:hypothetical protein